MLWSLNMSTYLEVVACTEYGRGSLGGLSRTRPPAKPPLPLVSSHRLSSASEGNAIKLWNSHWITQIYSIDRHTWNYGTSRGPFSFIFEQDSFSLLSPGYSSPFLLGTLGELGFYARPGFSYRGQVFEHNKWTTGGGFEGGCGMVPTERITWRFPWYHLLGREISATWRHSL